MYSIITCRQERLQIKIVVVVVAADQNPSHSQLSYLVAPWKILQHPLPCHCQQFFPAAEIHTGIVLVAHPVIPQTIEQAPLAMAYSETHPEKNKTKHINENTKEALSTDTLGIAELFFRPPSQHTV